MYRRFAALLANALSDWRMHSAPYGCSAGPSEVAPSLSVRWVDQTDAEGAHDHGGFNVLHLHEALVRAMHDDGDKLLTSMLHERCTVRIRERSYHEHAPELCESVCGQAASVDLLISEASKSLMLRMEPAELLVGGATRLHWRDRCGGRHGLSVVWSVGGRALHLVWAVEPPPTHREWIEALQQRDASLSDLLAEDVELFDADGGGGSCTTRGMRCVLPRLLRWSTDVAVASFDGSKGAMAISRCAHLDGRRTRLSMAGQWPALDSMKTSVSLMEETIEWRCTPSARRHDGFDRWRVRRVWRRTLVVSLARRHHGMPHRRRHAMRHWDLWSMSLCM